MHSRILLLCILIKASLSNSNECNSNSDCGVPPAYFCLAGSCHRCNTHDDCNNGSSLQVTFAIQLFYILTLIYRNHMRCSSSGKCIEKNLFDNFDTVDCIVSICSLLSTALATGGGIGGGGLLVPLFVFVAGINIKHAIPLSKATIFGAAIATIFVNAKKKHPFSKTRCLINLDVSALLEPPTLIGTIFGVLMNQSFPSWLVLFLLLILLLYTSKKTCSKAVKLHAKECGLKELDQPEYVSVSKAEIDSEIESEIIRKEECEELLIEESSLIQHVPLLAIGVSWMITLICSFLRGGEGTKSPVGIPCGSPLFWIVIFLPIPFLIVVTLMIGKYLVKKYQYQVAVGYPFEAGDTKWTKKNSTYYPFICVLAGIASGLLGVGGGLVKGPIMLEMGILPEVQTVTAGTMILFTSSATTFQFLVNGQFPGEFKYDYILWFLFMGFIGSFVGQHVVKYAVKKSGKASLLVFLLGFLILISGISLVFGTSKKVIQDFQANKNLGFEPICE